MAIAYEQFENLQIGTDHLDSSDSEPSISSDQVLVIDGVGHVATEGATGHELRIHRVHHLLQNKWPYKSSVLQLVLGVLLLALGIAQIIILPLVADLPVAVRIDTSNCYGIAAWSGIVFVLAGCTGLRAALSKSLSSVYLYFTVISCELLVVIATLLLIIIGYSSGWITLPGLGGDKVLFYVQLSVSLIISLTLLLVVYSFVQYYEDVLFGELQCCKTLVHCLLPCLCPRAVQEHELLNENEERPPSLPV